MKALLSTACTFNKETLQLYGGLLTVLLDIHSHFYSCPVCGGSPAGTGPWCQGGSPGPPAPPPAGAAAAVGGWKPEKIICGIPIILTSAV